MAVSKGKKPHVLAVPFPAQGHVTPLMKLSRLIVRRGIKVTFVNTEYVHDKILTAAMSDQDEQNDVVLASIPDGLPPEDDKNNAFKLLESLKGSMKGYLADLIEKINCSNSDEKISCIIADITVGWILEIAEKFGAEPVGFTPASAASLAVTLHIPNLIQQGHLDINGSMSTERDTINLSQNIPPWRKNELAWSFPIQLNTQKIFFECALIGQKSASHANWLLCNTFYELESSACDLNPDLLPIGPILPYTNNISTSSSFWPEDTSCLTWLDTKSAASVIYISFGSLAVFSQHQLDELALGLELSSRPFLWVVRSDLANGSRVDYPGGFLDRTVESGFGKIVEWAPQEKVLSHPSIACFLTHCGWNSIVEGLRMGVRFLCWPYFADQFHNMSYICEKWKIGLRIDPNEEGIRSRHEIGMKISKLFCDDDVKGNALKLKELAAKSVEQGGSSCENFEKFIIHLNKC